MILSDKDRELAEKPMTTSDWLMLYASAKASADKAPYHEASAAYLELADKCWVRSLALKEGRVMP